MGFPVIVAAWLCMSCVYPMPRPSFRFRPVEDVSIETERRAEQVVQQHLMFVYDGTFDAQFISKFIHDDCNTAAMLCRQNVSHQRRLPSP